MTDLEITLVILSFLTLLVVVAWICFSIHDYNRSKTVTWYVVYDNGDGEEEYCQEPDFDWGDNGEEND